MPSSILVAEYLHQKQCFLCHPTLNGHPKLCLRHFVLFPLWLLRFQLRSGQFRKRWQP